MAGPVARGPRAPGAEFGGAWAPGAGRSEGGPAGGGLAPALEEEGRSKGRWFNGFIVGGGGAGRGQGRKATSRSLPLPKVDVDDAAGQREREGHPGQGEAVAEAAPGRVLGQDPFHVNGVDQGPGEHCQACGGGGQESRRLHIPASRGAKEPPEGQWAAPLPAGSCGLLAQLCATSCCRRGLGHFHLWVSLPTNMGR